MCCFHILLTYKIIKMKLFKFLIFGIIFGILLIKGEVISWFRIQEMFKFQSIHMFGIIGCAVIIGIISVQIIKRMKIKAIDGSEIDLTPKPYRPVSGILGGAIFGMGWALTGACPGPIYTLFGAGYPIIIVVLLSVLLGTYVYGIVRDKLPH